VRNSWKGMRWVMVTAVSTMAVALPGLAAQSKDTATGAQDFLARTNAKVAAKVYFVDAQDRTNYVTGKYFGDIKTSKISNIAKTKEEYGTIPEEMIGKQLSDVRAVTLEAIDAEGRQNECATRITEVTAPVYDVDKSDTQQVNATFSFKLIETNQHWKYEPLTKFTTPAQVIDWTSAQVNRSPDSAITVVSRSQSFPKIYLQFAPGDLDLADRIEYAMKFLVMSCNPSAGT
jgi:hypothetical protein